MGELSKVVRWTAPGATMILCAALVVVFGRWALLQKVWPSADVGSVALFSIDPAVVALLIGAAVPLGFLVYQLYFYLHSRSESLIFQFVHDDIGRRVLARFDSGTAIETCAWEPVLRSGVFLRFPRGMKVPFTGATPTLWLKRRDDGSELGSTRGERRPAMLAHRRCVERNWRALETKIYTGSVTDEKARERIFATLDRLADIYHTLGATKVALGAGWGSGVAWLIGTMALDSIDYQASRAAIAVTLACISVGIGFGLLAAVLHENRRHCLQRRISALADACRLGNGNVPSAGPGQNP